MKFKYKKILTVISLNTLKTGGQVAYGISKQEPFIYMQKLLDELLSLPVVPVQ